MSKRVTSNYLNLLVAVFIVLVSAFLTVSIVHATDAGTVQGVTSGQSSSSSSSSSSSTGGSDSGEVLGVNTCDTENLKKITGYVFDATKDSDRTDEDGIVEVRIQVYTYDEDEKRVFVQDDLSDSKGLWEVTLCPGRYEAEIVENTMPSKFKLDSDKVVTVTLTTIKDVENVNFQLVKESGNKYSYLALFIILMLILFLLALFANGRRKKEN